MEDPRGDVLEIRALIEQTERIIATVQRLIEPGGSRWLEWRTRQLDRQLADARRELNYLTDQVQRALVEKVVEARKNSK